MEFIRNLPRRLSKSGRMESWALFKCPDCLQEVERHLSSGKVNKSCGCQSFSKEWRQKVSLANKGKKRTEEQNKRNSESHIGLQVGKKNPKFGKKHTEETRIKQSKANKGKKKSEEHKQKLSIVKQKQNNPNWQDGKSFEIYPMEFNKKLKQFILERDNYTCQCPDCEHKTTTLDAHHIDYDKKNSSLENVITLCRSCHAKTFGKNNRIYFIEFYQNIMINRIIECLL